jgi:hypothetical protein
VGGTGAEDAAAAGIERILRGLTGVVAVARLDHQQRRRVVDLEAQTQRSSVLPVRNLGVGMLTARPLCFALLKDSTFRPPGMPTVYLVEEGAPHGSPHTITVEGVRYAIIGEEVMDGAPAYAEMTIPLDTSFVIFPERRRGPDVSCFFMLPPIRFPELEGEADRLGVSGIISISPSLAADTFIRESFGFPPTNALATLLVGCTAGAPAHG